MGLARAAKCATVQAFNGDYFADGFREWDDLRASPESIQPSVDVSLCLSSLLRRRQMSTAAVTL